MTDIIVIQDLIHIVRGRRVMIDHDLARLYQVETKVLNQSVKRNQKRFPEDFMFQLTYQEFMDLKSQFVTSSWGGIRKMPYAFTEQGVAMLSGLLNSEVAIQANIAIMRAFVVINNYLTLNDHNTAAISALQAKLDLLTEWHENTLHTVNDLSEEVRQEIDRIYEAIGALSVKIASPASSPRKIGFK